MTILNSIIPCLPLQGFDFWTSMKEVKGHNHSAIRSKRKRTGAFTVNRGFKLYGLTLYKSQFTCFCLSGG